ncbi:hypothetical protein TruAng_001723 [Truncatella angustata]|nr:hypothetical protein TruAng_001723 [Truncatella angustata]
MDPKDLSSGIATLYFAFTIGNAVWIVVSAAPFHTRQIEEASLSSPSTTATLLEGVGLSKIRKIIGNNRLRAVLLGCNEAVTKTLYLPLRLCAATIVESVFSEWQSVKKKHAWAMGLSTHLSQHHGHGHYFPQFRRANCVAEGSGKEVVKGIKQLPGFGFDAYNVCQTCENSVNTRHTAFDHTELLRSNGDAKRESAPNRKNRSGMGMKIGPPPPLPPSTPCQWSPNSSLGLLRTLANRT